MHVERIHQVDSSDPDESGICEYHYEYDIYRFTDGSTCFVARSYTDEPDEAHFLRVETHGRPRALTRSDLTHPVFLSAQAHLHSEGKTHVRWLAREGYERIPAAAG